MKTNSIRTDRLGNYIGDGSCHVDYTVIDFSEYPQISSSVSLSETTESVYVTYRYEERTITVRFSLHVSNAVDFGVQLDGFAAGKNEILYRLGLKTRTFVPETILFIDKICLSKKEMKAGTYEFAELTIKEMYDLGKGADLSAYKGKIARDSKYLILGDEVREIALTTRNFRGEVVRLGRYRYE